MNGFELSVFFLPVNTFKSWNPACQKVRGYGVEEHGRGCGRNAQFGSWGEAILTGVERRMESGARNMWIDSGLQSESVGLHVRA